MKNKIIISILVFFGFFFFSCFNVNASEWLELSPSYCDSSYTYVHTSSGYTSVNYNSSASNVDLIDHFSIHCNFDRMLSANHEYRFNFILNVNNFPFLIEVARSYVFDTNMIFSSKSFYFRNGDGTSLYTREDLTDSVFSMSYSDDSDTIFYINFSFVSPVDLNSFEINLSPDNSIMSNSSHYIWKPFSSSSGTFTSYLHATRIFFDYGEFQGYEHPEICIGDQCQYSPYLGYSNSLIQDSVDTGGSTLRSIINSAWDNIQGFVTSSYYIFSLCTSLFVALPTAVQSVLIFTFTICMITVVWKVVRS